MPFFLRNVEVIALPASPRPLSEPHPLSALEKNNLRADAQLTRDCHKHQRRIHFITIDSLPALEYSISTDRPTERTTERSSVIIKYRATYWAPALTRASINA